MKSIIAPVCCAVLLVLSCLLPPSVQAQVGPRSESIDRQEVLRAHRAEDRRAEQRLERVRQRLNSSQSRSAEIDAKHGALVDAQQRLSEARAAVEAASAELYEASGLTDESAAAAGSPEDGGRPGNVASAHCDAGQVGCPGAALAQALLWEGLNLAVVDERLGQYFGTDHGVLVLLGSRMPQGLQPGDVIQELDGKAVATPRQAMLVLRGFGPGEKVAAQLVRERSRQSVEVIVPEAAELPIGATATSSDPSP
jgi:hypothetical protein